MSKYETTRATALETGITAGSNTSRETRQEYSAPFGSHSVCPHLITAFTVSGVSTAGGQDDINGAYTITRPYGAGGVGDANLLYATGANGHEFSVAAAGNDASLKWSLYDADFNPNATGTNAGGFFESTLINEFSDTNFESNQWKYDYTFPWSSLITWSEGFGGNDYSAMSFGSFVGGDI